MNVANASRGNVQNLRPELRTAQEAIDLPEVQEMLRKLADFNLGICMPHMHDEETGEFLPLPKELVQVEDGLAVSFRPAEEIRNRQSNYVSVAWSWREGAVTAMSQCYAYCEKGDNDIHRSKHRKE